MPCRCHSDRTATGHRPCQLADAPSIQTGEKAICPVSRPFSSAIRDIVRASPVRSRLTIQPSLLLLPFSRPDHGGPLPSGRANGVRGLRMFSESMSNASAAGTPSDADPVRAEIWPAATLVDGESGACLATAKWKLTAPSGLPILSRD